jgi:quinoprotein glucose dehydrogenase
MLAHWSHPGPRDRVLGSWHPLPAREEHIAVDALRPVLAQLLTASDKIRPLGIQLAARLGFRELGPELFNLSIDHERPAPVRVEALAALDTLHDRRLDEAVDRALADSAPALRAAAGEILAQRDPARALAYCQRVLNQPNDLANNSQIERQAAFATLATLRKPEVDAIFRDWLNRLAAGQVPPELQLDLLNAARERADAGLKQQIAAYEAGRKPADPLAAYRETLFGGDAERGQQIFRERAEVSCIRCHRVRGIGGEVGPDLSNIGAEKPREYLLTAIVEPNQSIAKGFETVSLLLEDGRTVSGVLKSETADELRLITPEGKLLTIPVSQIDERAVGKSSMPADLARKLETTELRDLVEFLATLRAP